MATMTHENERKNIRFISCKNREPGTYQIAAIFYRNNRGPGRPYVFTEHFDTADELGARADIVARAVHEALTNLSSGNDRVTLYLVTPDGTYPLLQ